MSYALVNGTVFDGDTIHDDTAVVVKGSRVDALIPAGAVPQGMPIEDLQGQTLLPGFIDLQVNGGGGVLFNDAPCLDSIMRIAAAHRPYGTTALLPTLISDSFDQMRCAMAAVREALSLQIPGVLGIHLEGPFLSGQKPGVHETSHFRPLNTEAVDLLGSLKTGITLATIAPELAGRGTIAALRRRGVQVWAGHSNASYAETRRALAEGLQGFTHLFNAMTPLQSREPGMLGAALEDRDSYCGIIVDGHHVHPASLRIALAAKAPGRLCLVTDAMPAVGDDSGGFRLGGRAVRVRDGRCTTEDGVLAGSTLTMIEAVRNARSLLGVDWTEAVRMASLYPAQALGLGARFGRIARGFRANFCLVDEDWHVTRSYVNGIGEDSLL